MSKDTQQTLGANYWGFFMFCISVANTPKKGNLPCVVGTVTKSVFAFTSKPSNLSDAKNQGLLIYIVRKGQLLSVSAQNLTFPNFNLQVELEG